MHTSAAWSFGARWSIYTYSIILAWNHVTFVLIVCFQQHFCICFDSHIFTRFPSTTGFQWLHVGLISAEQIPAAVHPLWMHQILRNSRELCIINKNTLKKRTSFFKLTDSWLVCLKCSLLPQCLSSNTRCPLTVWNIHLIISASWHRDFFLTTTLDNTHFLL